MKKKKFLVRGLKKYALKQNQDKSIGKKKIVLSLGATRWSCSKHKKECSNEEQKGILKSKKKNLFQW
ncbi:hypothetical protein C922_04796 [Plasmodium inui San Antonio 1]|uniref:Uncharacterized protein n=1 Tax=Plasmodium inui San Antonio 1 TaxID=1237626 RepID=W6ZZZ7_9APIC|nr:hypothetical protein C922_04796 [Plasmodium inui San Antonio 1]EUD64848.1 hypothetical protein C922_04796 [Plasmodium inui San Antonio 1]